MDQLEPSASFANANAQLGITQEPETPAPVVLGEWATDVAFPLEYVVDAALELEPRDRMAIPSDVALSLELLP
jgi:hypothetical protein